MGLTLLTEKSTMYTLGVVMVTLSALYYRYQVRKLARRPKKRRAFVMPKWAIKQAEDLETPLTSQQIESLNQRRPPEVWNNVLFFPDLLSDKYHSPTSQLKSYFQQARISIYLCMYVCSNFKLSNVLRDKYDEGLIVQCVSEYDTWSAHNSRGMKHLARHGIPVFLNTSGYMMHHKFAIIDEEVLITGSLNWTRQGIEANNENVMITTDPRIVSKFVKEFFHLVKTCKPWEEVVNRR